jgi:prepilin-type N-terminal cleavage/methylation domain-containing protein
MTRQRDEGFTLIELLMSVMLLTIIFGALVAAMEISFQTIDSARQRVTDSTGAQLLSSFLVSDIQSADHVQPTDFSCHSGGLLELRWTDASSLVGTTTDVVYNVESAGGGNSQLTRYSYTVVAGNSCTLVETHIIVRAVDSGAAATKVTCTPAPCNDSTRDIDMQVTALSKDPKSGLYQPYVFDVAGTRRVK